jgi:hypothetical protein
MAALEAAIQGPLKETFDLAWPWMAGSSPAMTGVGPSVRRGTLAERASDEYLEVTRAVVRDDATGNVVCDRENQGAEQRSRARPADLGYWRLSASSGWMTARPDARRTDLRLR